MTFYKHLLLWMLCGSVMPLSAQREIAFTEFDLDNGMHVILHQDNSTPIVALNLLYYVGSRDEDPERTGFAHFFEHLMFEGTKHIPRGEADKLITNAGGMNNATTNFDRTLYFEVLPSNYLEMALWFEAERMVNLIVDSAGVETQREVVKEERRLRLENQPYGDVMEKTFAAAFKKHPYRWTPIGSAQYIDQATIEEFEEFYRRYYVPNNATLSIAGDIDLAKTRAWIQKYFGRIPKGKPATHPDIVEPPLGGEVVKKLVDDVPLPGVVMAYRTPGQAHKDAPALNMLNTLLSRGKSSRLHKALIDKKQLALQAASFPYPTQDPGLSFIFALANAGGEIAPLQDAMEEEIERVKKELISEREYQKLRNQIENSLMTRFSSMNGIAGALAEYHVYYGNAHQINRQLEKLMAVSREDIKRVANTYLNKNNRVTIHYIPKTQ